MTNAEKVIKNIMGLIKLSEHLGIPADNLPYIFDRFWRGDKSRARTQGSSGLGLAIAKQLVLAHGGTISAESESGKGTTFTIELPA